MQKLLNHWLKMKLKQCLIIIYYIAIVTNMELVKIFVIFHDNCPEMLDVNEDEIKVAAGGGSVGKQSSNILQKQVLQSSTATEGIYHSLLKAVLGKIPKCSAHNTHYCSKAEK